MKITRHFYGQRQSRKNHLFVGLLLAAMYLLAAVAPAAWAK